jgi:hypothetical protein
MQWLERAEKAKKAQTERIRSAAGTTGTARDPGSDSESDLQCALGGITNSKKEATLQHPGKDLRGRHGLLAQRTHTAVLSEAATEGRLQ